MSQRTIVYTEIKRGGMRCTIEKDAQGAYFVRLKLKDQVREFPTSDDMDSAQMELYDRSTEWVNEIVGAASNKLGG